MFKLEEKYQPEKVSRSKTVVYLSNAKSVETFSERRIVRCEIYIKYQKKSTRRTIIHTTTKNKYVRKKKIVETSELSTLTDEMVYNICIKLGSRKICEKNRR